MPRQQAVKESEGDRQMTGLRDLTTRLALGTKALLAVVLLGGVLTIVTATPAAAFSSTPVWYNTSGTQASSTDLRELVLHDALVSDRAAAPPASPSSEAEAVVVGAVRARHRQRQLRYRWRRRQVVGHLYRPSGQSIAAFIGCGGGGGGGASTFTSATGGPPALVTHRRQRWRLDRHQCEPVGRGGRRRFDSGLRLRDRRLPCATLLAIAGGGGGAGAAGCTGNGGQVVTATPGPLRARRQLGAERGHIGQRPRLRRRRRRLGL